MTMTRKSETVAEAAKGTKMRVDRLFCDIITRREFCGKEGERGFC